MRANIVPAAAGDIIVTRDQVEAVRASERARLDADVYDAATHLFSDLVMAGNRLSEEAAIGRGMKRCGRVPDLSDARLYVEKAVRALAAYDAAMGAGRAALTNAEWKALRDGARS